MFVFCSLRSWRVSCCFQFSYQKLGLFRIFPVPRARPSLLGTLLLSIAGVSSVAVGGGRSRFEAGRKSGACRGIVGPFRQARDRKRPRVWATKRRPSLAPRAPPSVRFCHPASLVSPPLPQASVCASSIARYTNFAPLLGGSVTVTRQILDLFIGVRIPASQPRFRNSFSDVSCLVDCYIGVCDARVLDTKDRTGSGGIEAGADHQENPRVLGRVVVRIAPENGNRLRLG